MSDLPRPTDAPDVESEALADPAGLSKRPRLGRTTATVQVLVIVLAFVVMALALVPLALGYKGQVVLSGSMRPHLQVGDVNYIKPIAVSQIAVGAVITFHAPGDPVALVSHRVVAITGTGPGREFTTRGDANPANDSAVVPASAIVGVEAFQLPKIGRAALWIRNPTHYWSVAGAVFLLVVLYEGRILLREFRGWRVARKTSRAVAPATPYPATPDPATTPTPPAMRTDEDPTNPAAAVPGPATEPDPAARVGPLPMPYPAAMTAALPPLTSAGVDVAPRHRDTARDSLVPEPTTSPVVISQTNGVATPSPLRHQSGATAAEALPDHRPDALPGSPATSASQDSAEHSG